MPDRPDLKSEFAPSQRNVETQVWHAMLGVHGAVFSRLNRAMSREFGITLAKFDVLAQLYRNPAGMTQGNLSRQLKVTGGNVTGLVRRLCGDGLITRHMSPDDRRAFVVQLTVLGKETYLSARARHDAKLEEMFREIDVDDKARVLGILLAMAARVQPSSGAAGH